MVENLNITLDDQARGTYESFPNNISFMKGLKEIYVDTYQEEYQVLDGLNFPKLEAVKYKLGRPGLDLKVNVPGTEVMENA